MKSSPFLLVKSIGPLHIFFECLINSYEFPSRLKNIESVPIIYKKGDRKFENITYLGLYC